jgi:hypothetical protein
LGTERKQAILASQINSAFSNFALRYSVGLALYSGGEYPEVASATLLTIGNHLFALTAAHCIKKMDLAKIRVAYKELDYSVHFGFIGKGLLGGEIGDPFDVGYLEIGQSVTEKVPVEFLTLDRVALDYQLEESIAFLFGFPAKLVHPNEAQRRTFEFRSLGLLTFIATGNTFQNLINSEIDIALIYPEKGAVGEHLYLQQVPNPKGMSGGSMWIHYPNLANPIAGLHNARLIGIQNSWFERERIAKGNKLIYLLRLIAQDYPELKDILNQKFETF